MRTDTGNIVMLRQDRGLFHRGASQRGCGLWRWLHARVSWARTGTALEAAFLPWVCGLDPSSKAVSCTPHECSAALPKPE